MRTKARDLVERYYQLMYPSKTAPAFAAGWSRLVLVTMAISASWPAFASSSNRIVIRGSFSKGQHIMVEMSGEIWEAPEGQPYTSKPRWTARVPNVEGPHGYFADAPDAMDENPSGKLEVQLPENGQYTFSFLPCAMTSNYGHVAICAS
jgi:hypothetical protein